MPKIAVYKFFSFFFYAYDLAERRHVHVEAKKGRFRQPAKIWIEGKVEVFESGNLSQSELNEVKVKSMSNSTYSQQARRSSF
ncbi:MAG: DUF4160 domain-containing protein [Cytophagaceae bacterium]|nr:DUF4160 domain-containing protein [Cytophagaceae bacterium]